MESLQSPSRWPWNRYSHGGHGITVASEYSINNKYGLDSGWAAVRHRLDIGWGSAGNRIIFTETTSRYPSDSQPIPNRYSIDT